MNEECEDGDDEDEDSGGGWCVVVRYARVNVVCEYG